ncbi:MAG: tRNA-(ms[2]io[6]A)-hydroxylase [Bacteroidetes bacterium]|nr:MAG: tRNA-(ms[2]io[6]A)-hydroxylase [Bacteroidota bacterium]
MFKLKMKTDPYWAELATQNIREALIDHAFCEQKAASSAISIIVQYPEYTELVDAMSDLAREEMEHFQRVHNEIKKRGWILGRERKDNYVNEIAKFFSKGASRKQNLINKLLLAAMIEARSCERFRVLSEAVKAKDPELAEFYRELMISEANHYTLFIKFAKKYADGTCDVDKLWNEFLEYEGEVISRYGKKEHIHG